MYEYIYRSIRILHPWRHPSPAGPRQRLLARHESGEGESDGQRAVLQVQRDGWQSVMSRWMAACSPGARHTAAGVCPRVLKNAGQQWHVLVGVRCRDRRAEQDEPE